MKLLVKMMAVFVTIYAVGSMFRSVRISWPFAFIATALISFLGGAADRIVLPKLSRPTAVITDALFAVLALMSANRMSGSKLGLFNKTKNHNQDQQISLPYIGAVSAVLGGVESIYHEWMYKRDRYEHEHHEGGTH